MFKAVELTETEILKDEIEMLKREIQEMKINISVLEISDQLNRENKYY